MAPRRRVRTRIMAMRILSRTSLRTSSRYLPMMTMGNSVLRNPHESHSLGRPVG